MSILAVAQRPLKGQWVRLAASALSVLVLCAVPALGITRLAGEGSSFWGSPNTAVESLPLTFDAPAATVAARQVMEKETQNLVVKTTPKQDSATLAKDWMYTGAQEAQPLIQQLSALIFAEGQLNLVLTNLGAQQIFVGALSFQTFAVLFIQQVMFELQVNISISIQIQAALVAPSASPPR